MKRLLLGFGLSLFALSGSFAQPPSEGPADESAYWVLKIHGVLKPIPVISPQVVDFGSVEVGEVKRAQVHILNKGYGDLVIKKVFLKNGVEFGIKKTTCTKPLEFGKSCDITLEFKPDRPGIHRDTLYIETNDRENPTYTVSLKGEAIGAVVEVETTQLQQPLPVQQALEPVQQQPKQEQLPPPPVQRKNKTQQVQKQPPNTQKVVKKEQYPKGEKEKPKYTYWEVKPCDTLWDISASVYGTPLLWAAIYEANRDKIQDPWIIEVGQKLKIPHLTPAEREKYKKETLKLMEEMADRPLGPKCPF